MGLVQAHNLKVAGSSPVPATNKTLPIPLSAWMAVYHFKSFIKLTRLSTAACISASSANSSGVWLIPRWHRTNSIAIGQRSAMAEASWVAPEGISMGFAYGFMVEGGRRLKETGLGLSDRVSMKD